MVFATAGLQNKNMEEYYGYIYVIFDQKRNKVYIGKKKGSIETSQDYFGSGSIIKSIIKLRGSYFLKKIVLGVCNSKNELEYCETECISFFDATNKLYGYNICKTSPGGDTLTNHPNIQEIRKKISKNTSGKKKRPKSQEEKLHQSCIMKGRFSGSKNGMCKYKGKTYEEMYGEVLAKELKLTRSLALKGKSKSEEHCENLSKASKGKPSKLSSIQRIQRSLEYSGKGNPFYGKKHTLDTKQKISANHHSVSGQANPMYGKSVYSIWLEKYGRDEADRRKMLQAAKRQQTLLNRKNK